MDSRQEQLNNLNDIRSLMERSSSFISLSGLSGISAGIIGLAAAFILNIKIGQFLDPSAYMRNMLSAEMRESLIIYCLVLFTIVLILAFASSTFFTVRRAKKKALSVWDNPAKRLVVNLFAPLVIGGLFCIALAYHYYDFVILPSMLVFYGLALINAGKYTLSELKWLGGTECVLGLLALSFLPYSIWFWGLGFGVMNIVYGAVMYFKYER
jgi:hypothetical protein